MLLDTAMLDSLPAAFLLIQDERVHWASRGASAFLGAPADALAGRTFAGLLAPGEAERLRTFDEQRRAGWELPETARVRFVRVSDGAFVEADVQTGTVTEAGVTSTLYSAHSAADTQRAEALIGELADLGRDPQAMLGEGALLKAAEPIFLGLRWTGAFTEIVTEGSITRRVFAPPGHPVGEYGKTLIGRVLPLTQTPILAEVVRSREAVFLPNVPTLLSGPPKAAVPLGESMTLARLTRSAWCPIVRDDRVTHLLAVTGKDLNERDMVALRLFAAQIGAAIRLRELSAALLQRERLAAIGEMAAVIAHDMRNPLAVIFNALSGLRRPTCGPEDRTLLLDVIGEEAERMKRLVTDLLELAHPNQPMVESVALGPIIGDALAAVLGAPTPSPDGAPKVEVLVPATLPLVEVDQQRLHRALVNLLTNAFQHVLRGGEVRVSAERAGEGAVRLTVYNDRSPIAPAIAARVFDPFFTTRSTGTGLGLAVVRRVVEEVGGRVELDTTETGVAFSLWLRTDGGGAPKEGLAA